MKIQHTKKTEWNVLITIEMNGESLSTFSAFAPLTLSRNDYPQQRPGNCECSIEVVIVVDRQQVIVVRIYVGY
jgi:hypothetical protein